MTSPPPSGEPSILYESSRPPSEPVEEIKRWSREETDGSANGSVQGDYDLPQCKVCGQCTDDNIECVCGDWFCQQCSIEGMCYGCIDEMQQARIDPHIANPYLQDGHDQAYMAPRREPNTESTTRSRSNRRHPLSSDDAEFTAWETDTQPMKHVLHHTPPKGQCEQAKGRRNWMQGRISKIGRKLIPRPPAQALLPHASIRSQQGVARMQSRNAKW